MLTKGAGKRSKLSLEILGIFAALTAVCVFFFGFLTVTADSLVISFCEQKQIILTEVQEWSVHAWIQNISFAATAVLFVMLFLFFLGQRLAYLREIILGVEALRTQRMNYEIPLEGNNEFTELAESINFLSKTEIELKEKEKQMQQEKDQLIRSLSHDIRTPLTSILAYSEYMQGKDSFTEEEMRSYMELVQAKSIQMKELTNQLLEGQSRAPEYFEDGKLLLEQLAEEWLAPLEDTFDCHVDFSECSKFSAEFDLRELRRVFDNLASNVEKYAEPAETVTMKISTREDTIVIEQKNKCRTDRGEVESTKLGIKSIRRIAENYKGMAEVFFDEENFGIRIIFRIL